MAFAVFMFNLAVSISIMGFKSSKIYSIVSCTCPRCHESKMFLNANPYKFENWDKMHSDCPTCGLHFEQEPGFFQGAMYVSYGLGVALSVGVLLIDLLIGFEPTTFFIANTCALVFFAPILFRWSRSIYLNIFIKYDKSKLKH
jgi:uncharacterized protein (DUF983 family)